MAAITKASVKAYFETGDKPTQAQFVDLIDSYEDKSDILTAIASAASGGKLGIIRILGTTDVTAMRVGAVGVQLVDATATSSALNALGGAAVGTQIFGAVATASAIGHLGLTIGAVGTQVLAAAATSSALNALGVGTGDSPQFTAVNIGHATDTTLTRSAAGVVDVEGHTLVTDDQAQTISARYTFSSNPRLADGGAVEFLDSGASNTYNLKVSGNATADRDVTLTLPDAAVGLNLGAWVAWTPTMLFGGASTGVTYGTQAGLYCQIGKLIIAVYALELTNKGSATGDASVGGLPATVRNATAASMGFLPVRASRVDMNVGGGYYQLMASASANTTRANLYEVGDNVANTTITDADFQNTTAIYGMLIFEAA